jgi:hypothetical protein
MDPNLKQALGQPDVQDVLSRAGLHADTTVRKYIWRGFRPSAPAASHEVCAGDRSGADFVMDALTKLLNGDRAYDVSKTLLQNLNSITDSLIWSYKVTSDKGPIVDYALETDAEGNAIDPISTSKEATPGVSDKVVEDEILEDQNKAFHILRAAFDGDEEVQAYLDAMKEGYFKVEDIAVVTDIPAPRISEIRRKVKNFAKEFFGSQNFPDLKRKIVRGL